MKQITIRQEQDFYGLVVHISGIGATCYDFGVRVADTCNPSTQLYGASRGWLASLCEAFLGVAALEPVWLGLQQGCLSPSLAKRPLSGLVSPTSSRTGKGS